MDPTQHRSKAELWRRTVRRRRLRVLMTALVTVVLVAAALLLPIPGVFMYLPGPVRDVERLVRVSDAHTYASQGRLYMTTVSVDVGVTLAEVIEAAVDPHKQIVSEGDVTGGRSLERVDEIQRRAMEDSKQHAREVALAALGFGSPKGDGVRVMSTRDGSPADGELHAGDVIVAVQGAPVRTTCDVAAAISRLEVGERVALTVRSEGEGDRATVVLRTARDATTGRSYIGVEMADVNYSFDPGVDVNFITGEIAGPSAGLMFTLALYDRLTPDDLTAGRTIAGTGTIDCGGRVGPIGGVAQKVAAAEANGADVFLAPALNALDAREAAGDIRVVSVSSFADAIDYLQSAV